MPEGAGRLVESYRYFRSLGYVNIALVPASPSLWQRGDISLFANQCSELAEIVIEEFRQGRLISLMGIDAAVAGIVRNQPPGQLCGAGRGTLLVDVRGHIWPCHRWNKQSEHAWRMGNIYDAFDDWVRAPLGVPSKPAAPRAVPVLYGEGAVRRRRLPGGEH